MDDRSYQWHEGLDLRVIEADDLDQMRASYEAMPEEVLFDDLEALGYRWFEGGWYTEEFIAQLQQKQAQTARRRRSHRARRTRREREADDQARLRDWTEGRPLPGGQKKREKE